MNKDQTARIILHWQQKAAKTLPSIRIFLKRFSSAIPSHRVLSEEHERIFEQFDCLQCASCCKNSSPVFNRTDISRIADYLGIKSSELEKNYLKADKDGDYIPVSRPCPFLNPDNRCRVYEVRPKSCRGFPHTDNPAVWERHTIMAGNAGACPAAFAIIERFRNKSGK